MQMKKSKHIVNFLITLFIIVILTSCPAITNMPPELEIPDFTINEGETLTINLDNYSSDKNEDKLTYTIISGVGSIEDENYSYTPDFNASGTHEVTIEADDGRDKQTQDTFTIVVNDVNRNPVITIEDQNINEGETLELNLNEYAFDPDEDELSFKLISGVGTITDSVYTYRPGYDILKKEREINPSASTVDFEVTIQVNDGKGGEDQDSFTIEVTDVNREPTLDIPDQEMNEGETLTIDLLNYTTDPDASDTFSYSLLSGVGTITESIYSYTASYTDAGTKTVTVQVKDNKGATDTSTFEICVEDVNRPPKKPTKPKPENGAKNQPIDITLSWDCSDPDGDPISYDIYFGTQSTPSIYEKNINTNEYNPGNLEYEKEYFWKIVAKDGKGGETSGSVWSFETVLPEYNVTVTTSQSTGLEVLINGDSYLSPKTKTFKKYEAINIGVTTPQEKDKSEHIEGNDTRYTFEKWNDDVEVATRTEEITEDITYTALMNKGFKVETASNPEELTEVSGPGWYEEGTNQTFIAPDVTAYTFDHWEINGNNEGANNSITVTINSPKKIIAIYSIEEYTLTINAKNGSVSKSPEQKTYTHGTEVELEAIPNEGYCFDHWEGDLTGIDNPNSIVMNSNKEITAVFNEEENQPPTVTKVSGPSGMIDESSSTFNWSGNDPDGSSVYYDYRKDSGSWYSTTGTSYTWSGYSEGSHIFEVRAQDNDGAYSNTISWSFTYQPSNYDPNAPSNPNPANYAQGININPTLSWDCSDPDGDSLTYDIYFGTSSSPSLKKTGHTSKSYSPGTLTYETTYYWKIVAKDGKGGETAGPIWHFSTETQTNPSGKFKVANSWGIGGWENVPDGYLYITYDAMIENNVHCFILSPNFGYEPHCIAVFEIDHDVRNDCTIKIGVGDPQNPTKEKSFTGNYYHDGGEHPFPNNKMVLDITEFLPINDDVYLKVYDGSNSDTGTIEYFAVEYYDSYSLSNPDIIYTASGFPVNTTNNNTTIVNIADVNLSEAYQISSEELDKYITRTLTDEDFEIEEPYSVNELYDGYATGLLPLTEEDIEWLKDNAKTITEVRPLDTLPSNVDNSNTIYFPPIGNQDGVGSCVAFSFGYYTNTYYQAINNNWDLSGANWEGGYYGEPTNSYQDKIMSPNFVYNQINDGEDGGSAYVDAIKLISNIGECSWEKFPYKTSNEPNYCTEWPDEEAWKEAPKYRSSMQSLYYISVDSWTDIDTLKNLLNDGYLISISINANKYEDLTNEDVWNLENYNNITSTNHANTIVGYEDD